MKKEAVLSIKVNERLDLVDSAHRWFEMFHDAVVKVVGGNLFVRLPCHRKIIGCSAVSLNELCDRAWVPNDMRNITGCGRCKGCVE